MVSQCMWLARPTRLQSGGPSTVPAEPGNHSGDQHPVSSAGSHPAPGTGFAGSPTLPGSSQASASLSTMQGAPGSSRGAQGLMAPTQCRAWGVLQHDHPQGAKCAFAGAGACPDRVPCGHHSEGPRCPVEQRGPQGAGAGPGGGRPTGEREGRPGAVGTLPTMTSRRPCPVCQSRSPFPGDVGSTGTHAVCAQRGDAVAPQSLMEARLQRRPRAETGFCRN